MTNPNFVTRPDGPPPLPATVTDLLAQRRSMQARTLHDDVDRCHLELWENGQYRELFLAIHPSQTIEGSFPADDFLAAQMIRKHAVDNRIPIAAEAKLAAIVFSLHIICRRYRMTRQDRNNLVNGESLGMDNAAD